MPSLPEPRPGLVFRYGYLWLREAALGRDTPIKDRPACIVLAAGSRVIIVPITTKPPLGDDIAVEIHPAERAACGLDAFGRSWVIVSEFNLDIWPNADMSLVPGTDRFEFGVAPRPLLRRIASALAEARRTGRGKVVRR